MPTHGYSDSIHHALAFCAKHHPGPVSRYDGHNPLLTTANVAVTTTFKAPCIKPIRFARVLPGMFNQSARPNAAATSPPTTPTR